MDEEDLGYRETKWDRFLGEAVCARLNKENYHGIVKHVSQEHGIVYLQPSVLSNACNRGIHIAYNLPLMIPFEGNVVTPIIGGMEELESFVRNYNTSIGITESGIDKLEYTKSDEFDFYAMQTKWDVYLGKAVYTRYYGENNYGVVRQILQEQNGVYLQPSVVYTVTGNRFGIVSELPTMVPFDVPLVFPLKGPKDFDIIVRYYNTSREAIEAQEAAKKQK